MHQNIPKEKTRCRCCRRHHGDNERARETKKCLRFFFFPPSVLRSFVCRKKNAKHQTLPVCLFPLWSAHFFSISRTSFPNKEPTINPSCTTNRLQEKERERDARIPRRAHRRAFGKRKKKGRHRLPATNTGNHRCDRPSPPKTAGIRWP